MEKESYSPILSEHDTGYYRVVMEQVGTTYTIHTGDNMTRILEEFALPKEMRVKLAMIKAYEKKDPAVIASHTFSFTVWSPMDMYTNSFTIWSPMDLYMNTFPPEFNDIGWRCKPDPTTSREFYCVITTAETLDSLRGELL